MAEASQAAALDAQEVNPRAYRHPAVARTLGLTFTHLSRDRVAAELPASDKLANRKNILSGGVRCLRHQNVTTERIDLPS